MDSGETQYFYKETRLNLEPSSSSLVVNVRLPGSNSRGQRDKRGNDNANDVSSLESKYLASASSIYHRKWHDSPRSFLWRVLENGTVLSVRVADVYKKDKESDSPLVLNFHFTTPIQPNCVAFADPQEHDALCVFVIDQSKHLWTFTLRPDLFRKRSAVDAGLSDLAKRHVPTGLSLKHPHRMVAVSTDILLITVNDGGMIRFDRTSPSDSSAALWKETFFNVLGWTQNLRSYLPFQGKHTVKCGSVSMEYSTATAIEVTSLGLEGSLFAVTVCLDHRMRIWNLNDGQILYTGDILDLDRTPQEEVGKWSIDPSLMNLVRIVGHTKGSRICATYSPVGAGEFKLWAIRAKGTHMVAVDALFPKASLIPVTPSSSDVWTLADFVLANPQQDALSLWILWKNNMTYRVQKLALDRENMERCWEENWESVYADVGVVIPQASGPHDPTDVTEKWLQTILQPGRFTKSTLNLALAVYEGGTGLLKEPAARGRGLADSICSVLGSTASLEQGPSGVMEYEQFRSASEDQWRRFYRLLVEFDKRRGEAVGLSFDPNSDVTWVVCADLVSVIRECGGLERLYYNLSSPDEDQAQQAALIRTALLFVDGLPDNLVQMSEAALRLELFEESSKTDLERISYFSDKSGFWRGITDEDCAQVVEVLGQNFAEVTDRLYSDVLQLIAPSPESSGGRKTSRLVSDFGKKVILKATQDLVESHWKICFSQLILLVHMEFEYDNEEDALHNRVDVGFAFRQLVAALRRLEFLRWLSRTEIQRKGRENSPSVTALEANLGHLHLSTSEDDGLAIGITDLVADLCSPDSEIEIPSPLVQCRLLQEDRADLALDISPFSDRNPFSVYIQGRVFLALRDFDSAAINFRKAAIGMGSENAKINRQSAGLVDETEWNLINGGLAKYYSHIVALFERHKAYSFVVDFARLAIQFFTATPKSKLTKTDMLSRLFNAAVATSQFQLAHSTLLSLKDGPMRHSSLRKLVDRMAETYHNQELVALPFPGMQQDVESILDQKCKSAMDVVNGFPYHQILYSWRIRHGNFRGAASVLLDRIRKLRRAGEGDNIVGQDVLDTPVTKQYLLLINALSCVDKKEAWIYDEGQPDGEENGNTPSKRTVVSLADVRKQYQDELDRITAIQNNQFGFEADDVMDVS